MKRPVFAHRNLPTRLPVSWTAIAYLLLDRVDAPGWAWGVTGTLIISLWILAIVAIGTEGQIDVFKRTGGTDAIKADGRDLGRGP